MNIVIFGPPGAGKGTQSNFIVRKFNLHQLSTGELLRSEIKNKTKLGQDISSIINSGNLVSNEIVSDLIEKYITNKDYQHRLIFDGYPRNLIQAKNLEKLLSKNGQKIGIVLKLSVRLEIIKKRIMERKQQEERVDDDDKVAVKRFEMYEKNIAPVIDFYKQSNLLTIVNGEKSVAEINSEISDLIETIKGSMAQASKSRKEYSLNDIYVYLLNDMSTSDNSEPVSIPSVLDLIKDLLPEHLMQEVDSIYIGEFDTFKERNINAFYDSGAIYVSNVQENIKDMADDIIHEFAHSLESKFGSLIYSDPRRASRLIALLADGNSGSSLTSLLPQDKESQIAL